MSDLIFFVMFALGFIAGFCVMMAALQLAYAFGIVEYKGIDKP